MRAFDASDVLYNARVQPFMKAALGRRHRRETIITSQFLREISWVSPAYVAQKLGQQLSTGADDGDGHDDKNSRPARACTAPASTPPPTAT